MKKFPPLEAAWLPCRAWGPHHSRRSSPGLRHTNTGKIRFLRGTKTRPKLHLNRDALFLCSALKRFKSWTRGIWIIDFHPEHYVYFVYMRWHYNWQMVRLSPGCHYNVGSWWDITDTGINRLLPGKWEEHFNSLGFLLLLLYFLILL